MVADERLGVPLEDALEVVARRMHNDDLRQAVLVATLQRETGGNTAEVIDRVAETIRERAELRRHRPHADRPGQAVALGRHPPAGRAAAAPSR